MRQIYVINDYNYILDADVCDKAFDSIEAVKEFLRDYGFNKSFDIDDSVLFITEEDYENIIYKKDTVLEEQRQTRFFEDDKINYGFAIIGSSLEVPYIEVEIFDLYEDANECHKDIAYEQAKIKAQQTAENLKNKAYDVKDSATETFNRLQEDERVKEATRKFEAFYKKAIDSVNQAISNADKEPEILVQYLAVEGKYIVTCDGDTLFVYDKKNEEVEFENIFAIQKLSEKQKREFNLVKDVFQN